MVLMVLKDVFHESPSKRSLGFSPR